MVMPEEGMCGMFNKPIGIFLWQCPEQGGFNGYCLCCRPPWNQYIVENGGGTPGANQGF